MLTRRSPTMCSVWWARLTVFPVISPCKRPQWINRRIENADNARACKVPCPHGGRTCQDQTLQLPTANIQTNRKCWQCKDCSWNDPMHVTTGMRCERCSWLNGRKSHAWPACPQWATSSCTTHGATEIVHCDRYLGFGWWWCKEWDQWHSLTVTCLT